MKNQNNLTMMETNSSLNEEGSVELTFDCSLCDEHWIRYANADEDDACPNCGTESSPTQSVKVFQKPLSW